jgi:uncharacterized membrane protein YcaP (DUF421 family)
MEPLQNLADRLLGLSKQAHELEAAQVCLRAVIVFLMVLLIVRVGKKRFLSSATAFDAVLVIMIGSVASRAISGTAPFFASLAGTATLVAVHWLVALFSRESRSINSLVKGRSTLLVHNGQIDATALRRSFMTEDDLIEDLRQQGVDDPSMVKAARLERSGRLSVIKE